MVVLDPFGGLYRAIREFVATGIEQAMAGVFDGRELLARYRFLDLNDPDNPLRINPLAPHPLETVEQQVDDLMKAVVRLLGGNLEEQRKLRNILRGVFSLTAELNRLPREALPPYLQAHIPLTVAFGAEILNMSDQQRLLLLNVIPKERRNDFRRQYWQFFSGLSGYERNQVVQSSWNVFQYLLDDELVKRFFGTQSSLDLPQLMREGTSLICFLPVGANLAGARLVGKYLTTKLQHSAYRRSEPERRQRIHLYLDEFHQWTDQSFADSLTNLRQFGVNVTCAHQSQTQPPFDTTEGRSLLRTIQSNSRLKAIFRLARPDAEDLARELFELSQQKPNYDALDRTVGSSEQHGTMEGSSTSSGYGTRTGAGHSQSQRLQSSDGGVNVGSSQTQMTSSEQGSRSSHSTTTTKGTTESTTSRTVYFTLEGEREVLVNALQRLPQRQFYFAHEPLQGHLLEAPFVPDELYHYAAVDLPAELMEWQRLEVAQGAAVGMAEQIAAFGTAKEPAALPQPSSEVTWEVATPGDSQSRSAESVVIDDAEVAEEVEAETREVDKDDPFLD